MAQMDASANKNPAMIWKDRKHHLWFPWSFTKYYIVNERLMIQKGFLNTELDETLLYRIVDITMKQSLAGKIFGTGNLIIKAKIDSNPQIILENISNPAGVRDLLSNIVEESRQKRNVVGKEFYGEGHAHTDHSEDGICDFEEQN